MFVLALFAITFLYVLHSYRATLNTEIGFLYHPDTNRIYEVELSAWVGHETLARRLMPWSKAHYGVTGIGDYLGPLNEILELIEKDKSLKQTDQGQWVERRGQSANEWLEKVATQGLSVWEFSYTDIAYLIRTDIDRSDELINLLPGIEKYDFDPSEYMLTVDAFVANRSSESNSHDIETLSQALLIRGRSAAYLRYLGVNDPYFTNVSP
ncbi:hypothetical protein IC757_16475 [Wenzhouxiangella sp. AB-CW3]|uniref:hypothetical protein n=1 Tax=Wenzhouxiangella sp. AB-CW3 TaxID=2771012 RepID=UPI00168BB215|nr:hypothetical protein [Wenzhouxiangella sp. AB-CW3]QOC22575.1 hypothetical protein IC757_16475 [Wenzhouxiangella sp. AB-CW3]